MCECVRVCTHTRTRARCPIFIIFWHTPLSMSPTHTLSTPPPPKKMLRTKKKKPFHSLDERKKTCLWQPTHSPPHLYSLPQPPPPQSVAPLVLRLSVSICTFVPVKQVKREYLLNAARQPRRIPVSLCHLDDSWHRQPPLYAVLSHNSFFRPTRKRHQPQT